MASDSQDPKTARGRLKIFLGYASGVGKSFRMLDEGRRRRQRGEDVVLVAAQAKTPGGNVVQLLGGFETVPPLLIDGVPALDMPAILARRPQVVLVDGLAHRNPPGSANAERWQDVQELLAAGISVITTVNLQYVKEKQDEVAALRGRRTTESVPEAFLRLADDIEVVDVPPGYARTHSDGEASGDVVLQERVLSELREMALLLAAEVVDYQLEAYLRRHGIAHVGSTHERILVCASPRSSAAVMVRRGRRQADRFHGELHVVHLEEDLPPEGRATVEQNLSLARDAGARVEVLHGRDLVTAVLRYAREHGITQIFVGHTRRARGPMRFRRNLVERLIRDADGIDVRVFPRD